MKYFILFTSMISAILFTSHKMSDKTNFLSDLSASDKDIEKRHPFLIVREDMYPELRERATRRPWDEIKNMAYDTTINFTYDETQYITLKLNNLKSLLGAASLMYILDPTQRQFYKMRIFEALEKWDDILNDPKKDDPDFEYTVYGGSAFFASVLALDIIHNDLTQNERDVIELKLDEFAIWLQHHGTVSWEGNAYGCLGVWGLYQNDDKMFSLASEKYKQWLFSMFTEKGIFKESFHYAKTRTASEWLAKCYFIDVCEFTQKDPVYYNNKRLKFHFESLYAGGVTPFYKYLTFGDASPSNLTEIGPRTFNLHQFSPKAAQYAAWILDNTVEERAGKANYRFKYKGELLYFLLMDQNLPQKKKPTSQLWGKSLATFWQSDPDEQALMAALWSCLETPGNHAHKDTNAIHISAYGENILRNSGYTHWEIGVDQDDDGIEEFDWDWIHNTAESSNTIIVGDRDHQRKSGGGLTEGFTSLYFDYACAQSGKAMNNGKHWRSLCFIHPQDGLSGYFATFDQVLTLTSDQSISIAFHPDSNDYYVSHFGDQFTWKLNKQKTNNNVQATIYLATPPHSSEVLDGGLGAGFDEDFVGKYLLSHYYSNSHNQAQAVTIIYPHDHQHPKPLIKRIFPNECTGALIKHTNTITDTILESSSKNIVDYNNISFKGKFLIHRQKSDQSIFYFIRHGTYFENGQKQRNGFKSEHNISLHLQGTFGNISFKKTTQITFFHPHITGICLNDIAQPIITSGDGFVTVLLEKKDINSNLSQQKIELLTYK